MELKFYKTFSYSDPKNSDEIKAKDKMKGTIIILKKTSMWLEYLN